MLSLVRSLEELASGGAASTAATGCTASGSRARLLEAAAVSDHHGVVSHLLVPAPAPAGRCRPPGVGELLPALDAAVKAGNVRVLRVLLGGMAASRPGGADRAGCGGESGGGGSGGRGGGGGGCRVVGEQALCVVNVLLQYAATSDQVEVLRALLEAGADPRVNANTALRTAVLMGNEDMVAALLAAGADAGAIGYPELSRVTSTGRTSLLRRLLEAGVDPNARGGMPLFNAAVNRHEGAVRLLLAAGADPRVGDGLALMAACRGGHVAVVAAFLDAGVPPTALDCRALAAAVEAGQVPVLELLLKRAAAAATAHDEDDRGVYTSEGGAWEGGGAGGGAGVGVGGSRRSRGFAPWRLLNALCLAVATRQWDAAGVLARDLERASLRGPLARLRAARRATGAVLLGGACAAAVAATACVVARAVSSAGGDAAGCEGPGCHAAAAAATVQG
ncbi:hypothetical protein GPECTOR_413g259 [Gonium pectorale]|uniref:Uncharacterized protein n=1 Tax=Gonium pectorale TaxID=33097 RepID=A0A150FVC3_GONPE|nr:hypothetical protein GPECTOR_413g259 [Gonium pectorale]|eukprot:KXZ41528.1 hypothetical protein GPECTOR_413g259 [Gonium pectorale]